MLGKLSGWDDTIVALATPPGIGAIGIIRVSGKQAFDCVNTLFPSKNLIELPSHTIYVGMMKQQNEILDQVVISLFKAPASYTGEDVIEISSHGSPFIQEKIITAITNNGARLAKPGEFTQRAFLNGKIDLTQAEAVADLILSNSEISRNTALQNIRGGFSTVLKNLRDQLLTFSALIELELDFSQEDVEFADRTQLFQLVTNAQHVTTELIKSFALGNVIKNGVQVAIIGKPNAGKSTLLNALLNEDRAIVSEMPGTTRDTIEEVINIDGILFRLIDTAGIRMNTDNAIESMGVVKSFEKMANAHVVIYLFDVNEMSADELIMFQTENLEQNQKVIFVGNKIDQSADTTTAQFLALPTIFISAKNLVNIDGLKQRLKDMVYTGELETKSTIVTNARHYEALQKVAKSLNEILTGMQSGLPFDLITIDIKTCLHFLGEITGEITNEDQLDYIFSKFCIGK